MKPSNTKDYSLKQNRNFQMSHAKEWSIQYDSGVVLAMMIGRSSKKKDVLVFFLSALAEPNSCVCEESILAGYSLKSFTNTVAFLVQDQEVDYYFGFFGENTIILAFFTS